MLDSQTFTYVDRHGLEPEPIFIVTRAYDTPSSPLSNSHPSIVRRNDDKSCENAVRRKRRKKKRVERKDFIELMYTSGNTFTADRV